MKLVLEAIEHAAARGMTVDEALAHWGLAGGSDLGARSGGWLSIAFGVARENRDRQDADRDRPN